MTSITWKNLKTGKKEIKIYRSKDALDKTLKSCTRVQVGEQYELHLVIKQKGKATNDLILYGVSYEEDDEKALFQKFGIIPKDTDYD